jgi:hypothetical protein
VRSAEKTEVRKGGTELQEETGKEIKVRKGLRQGIKERKDNSTGK